MNVRNHSFIRMGFYRTGIDTILDLLGRYAERTGNAKMDDLASRINANVTGEAGGFLYIRLSITEWEQISEAFLECGNDAWEASIASEINERLQHHGW